MNKVLKTTLIALCIVLPGMYACAQVQPPPPPGGPGGGPGRGPGGAPGMGEVGQPVRQLSTIRGTVRSYMANDQNEYSGLTLQTNGDTVAVRFAPHLAAQLMELVKAGSAASFQGTYETTPEGLNVFQLVTATAGERTIYDGPPALPPANPTAETMQSFSGSIASLRMDMQGRANGIVLSDGKVIATPPHVFDQLQSYLKSGTAISGVGAVVIPPTGVVLAKKVQVIRAQTLTVNGQTFMVR